MLASADGDREVALADFFTGYRETVLRPGELVRAVRVPLPLARSRHFRKIAKRRYDDISSVAVGVRPRRRRRHRREGPHRPRRRRRHAPARPATEAALEGRPWTQETVEEAAAVLAGEGTPIDDQRASAAYRSAMLGNALRASWAEDWHEGCRMSHLSERPDDAVVGRALPHESAALHVTGHALYTDDLVHRTPHVLHAHPVCSPHAARPGHPARRVAAALAVPGVVRVLTADDVPGINDAGVKHDEPLFPDEVMFVGHAVCWVLGETLEAARLGAAAVEVDYEPLPAIVSLTEAIDAEQLPGRPARRRAR